MHRCTPCQFTFSSPTTDQLAPWFYSVGRSAKKWRKMKLHIDKHYQNSRSSQFISYSPTWQMTIPVGASQFVQHTVSPLPLSKILRSNVCYIGDRLAQVGMTKIYFKACCCTSVLLRINHMRRFISFSRRSWQTWANSKEKSSTGTLVNIAKTHLNQDKHNEQKHTKTHSSETKYMEHNH